MTPILNQKRYEAVFNEILVLQNRFLTFQSATGTSSDVVSLPLQSAYLHTCYYRLHAGYHLQPEDKRFAAISWEVFNIIKENFPSKIFLSQENLDLCKPTFLQLTPTEELRRQISCLLSLKEEDRNLTLDEMEDAWHTLQFAEKLNDQRALNTCLELIASQANSGLGLSHLKTVITDQDTLQRIIMKNDYTQLSSNKLLANEILEKVNSTINPDDLSQSLQRQVNEDDTVSIKSTNSDFGEVLAAGQKNQNVFEKPTSTRMCLFQLSESNDINRVTMILETLVLKSKDSLTQLRKKHNLNHKLITILKKYCNAEYGFDHMSTRQGQFQYNLLKLMIILAEDYVVFLEYLQTQTFDFLSQLIEEGIIFAYEDSQQGINRPLSQGSSQPISSLLKFLMLSLDFMELCISKQFQEYMPNLRDNLRKIQARFSKIIQKKDNPLLQYFLKNYQQVDSQGDEIPTSRSVKPLNSNQMNIQDQEYQNQNTLLQSSLSGDQLSELRSCSEELYKFAVELSFKLQKVEALNDIYEEHEDKHARLFLKVCGPSKLTKKENLNHQQQQQRTNMPLKSDRGQVKVDQRERIQKTYISDNRHQFEEKPQKLINNNFTSAPDDTLQTTNKENYHTSTNVFLKNQIEQGFKRVTSARRETKNSVNNTTSSHAHQYASNISSNNKETLARNVNPQHQHYIGSPYDEQPLQHHQNQHFQQQQQQQQQYQHKYKREDNYEDYNIKLNDCQMPSKDKNQVQYKEINHNNSNKDANYSVDKYSREDSHSYQKYRDKNDQEKYQYKENFNAYGNSNVSSYQKYQ